MNKKKYEKHLMNIVLSFIPISIVFFIYDTQLRLFRYDSGLWFYVLLCITEVILAIIINLRGKNNKNVPSKKWREQVKKWSMKT